MFNHCIALRSLQNLQNQNTITVTVLKAIIVILFLILIVFTLYLVFKAIIKFQQILRFYEEYGDYENDYDDYQQNKEDISIKIGYSRDTKCFCIIDEFPIYIHRKFVEIQKTDEKENYIEFQILEDGNYML